MKGFISELGMKQNEYPLYCDSQSAMDLAKNAIFHSRIKHIDIRYHYIRELIKIGEMKLQKIHTYKNLADMLTKSVPPDKLRLCTTSLGLH